AEAIFALRGEELPEKYKEEFAKPVFSMGAYPVSGVNPDQGFLLPGERDWDFPRGPYASSYGGKLPDVVTFRRGSDVPGVSGVRKEGESW
ncbi:MAG: hypothetical protein NTU97_00130, partial [Candidatus Magasanikbacteria bacterium]|nr:hypothetical protein [Candidatus Magasanikbacteria bacterium]